MTDVIKGGVKSAAGSAGESAMEGVANFFNEAAEWAVKNLTAAWLNAPSPDVQSSASTTSWLSERLTFFVLAAMVGAFFVAAYKLATAPRAEHVRDLGETLVRVVLTTTIAATLITTAVEVGDLFADWIIAQADVDLGNSVLTKIPNPGLLLVLALIMAVAQLIQLVLMIVRNAMIVYLAAVLPLAAASSSTAAGKQWWSKSIAWLIAFVLYKPVAALIYAGAFKMLSDENTVVTQITGVVAVLMAIFALPAMMRFLVPATAQMTAGNAGTMALGLVGAAAATGAVVATGGAAAGGGGGFSGATSAPTGGGMPAAGLGGGGGAPSGAPAGTGPGGAGSSDDGPAPTGATSTGEEGGSDSADSGGGTSGSGASGSPSTPVPAGNGAGPSGSAAPVVNSSASTGSSGTTSWHDVAGAARTGADLGRQTNQGASGAIEEN